MIGRLFDLVFALTFILLLLPLLLLLSVWLLLASGSPVIFRQKRVGRHGKDFTLYKFRTMRPGSEQGGLLTVGSADARITAAGRLLRKCKLDELPQLFNVVLGDMSMVGPRPEVRKYVDLYDDSQRRVLGVRPGITDYASLAYINESETLAGSQDPEHAYVSRVMPDKLRMNLEYMERRSLWRDLAVILKTAVRIVQPPPKASDRRR